MTALSRLVLWSLRTARGGRITVGTVAMWGRAFRELGEAPSGREALETILRYLVEVLGEDRVDVIDAILAEERRDHAEAARSSPLTAASFTAIAGTTQLR